VVQSNASSSEESASAAEELSSQAAEMNHIVEELVQLVGGSSGGSEYSDNYTENEYEDAHNYHVPLNINGEFMNQNYKNRDTHRQREFVEL